MLDAVRRYVEAGRDALTPKKAEELARALIKQGQARADQAGRLARDLVEWSRKNSERFRDTIRHEVKKQMSKAGVATKQEVDSLKRRIRELEGRGRAAPARRATTQRSAGSRTGGGRTSGARKSQTTGATRIPKRRAGARATSRGTAGGSSPPRTRGA
jgi:polyhydroxyalkanoate synthesis regulator phasin